MEGIGLKRQKIESLQQFSYISDLQSTALFYDRKPGNTLIEMEDGRPGASVNVKLIGFPWLVGSYTVSEKLVVEVLSKGNTEMF